MSKVTAAQFAKLQAKHKTDAAIGEALGGITRQAVHQMRKKFGIESLVAKNDERNAQIVAAYTAGATGVALAAKYKISISQAYRIIREAVPKKTAGKKSIKKSAAVVKSKKAAPVAKKPAKKTKKK